MSTKNLDAILQNFTSEQSDHPIVIAGIKEVEGVSRNTVEAALESPYYYEQLTSEDTAALEELCQFYLLPEGGGLSEDEVEQPETLASELENTGDAEFFCHVMREDPNGAILSGVYGSYNPQTKILLTRFQATHEKARSTGASQHLLAHAMNDLHPEYAALEGVDAAEGYWNRYAIEAGNIGHRRLYIQQEPDLLTEFPYELPPLDYDPATGENTMGEDSIPEHLMVAKRGAQNVITGQEVKHIVLNGFGKDWYTWDRDAFVDSVAHERHVEISRDVQKRIANQVQPSDNVYMLSREERQFVVDEGHTVEDYEF